MGVCFLKEITMKTIIALAFFLAVASADTCTDCTAVVSALGAHLVSEHSLAEQDEIMVGGLCPQLRMSLSARSSSPTSGSPSLSFSGRHTTHLRPTGCVLEFAR